MYEVILLPAAAEFLEGLSGPPRAKADAFLLLLKVKGPDLHRPHSDVLRGKIRELRCGFARLEYRFLYFFHDKKVILTHGFLKKTERVPDGELRRAERLEHRYWEAFREKERPH